MTTKKSAHPRFTVLVGNLGTIVDTLNEDRARERYLAYVQSSLEGAGRVAGEPVWLLKDGQPIQEHSGHFRDLDEDEPCMYGCATFADPDVWCDDCRTKSRTFCPECSRSFGPRFHGPCPH